MRALITGVNGFVGGHLAEQLLACGSYRVFGVARQPLPSLAQLHGQIEYVQADLSDPQQTHAALAEIAPDVIFHLAGQANVHRSFQDPTGTLQTNVFAQLNLYQALIALNLSPLVLVACSNEIYGQVRPEELPLNEQTPLRPVSPYAVSKVTQDLMAYQYFVSHKIRCVRLRPFNHIGPRQEETFVASAFAAQVARIEMGLQPPVLRVGNLSAERDFTDVRDMVRAYDLAAQRAEPGCAYNIGSGRTVSIRWILDTLVSLSQVPIEVEQDPARMRPADVPRVVSDCRRFRHDTGWEPQIPLEQTLLDILDHWREVIRRDICD
ncbi:MAG: GDP-mannose 4,6-dehydratase [Roseiflexaceae bacterium]